MSNELKQSMIVTRNGQLDTDFLKYLEREDRRRELAKARQAAVERVFTVGKGIIWLFTPEEIRA